MRQPVASRMGPPSQRLRPYPAHKDSGVEWLGEIPAHWEVSRADAFLRYEKVQVEPSSISDEVVFHYSIPSVQDIGDGVLEPPSEIDSAKLRILGDRLLVSKLNPRKGVVLIASEKDVPTVCSSEFVPFEVRGCELRWALYLFLAESTRRRLSAVVRSATRSHQRAEIADIVKIWHGLPTIPEQRAIATFLDRKTARIDALVAKKERLIELLQEQRTALITRAVTKGLDPNVPMKDSGVEWLGEIPAHWEVKRLKEIVPGITVGIVVNPSKYYVDDGVPCLRSLNIAQGRVSMSDLVFISPSANELHRKSKIFEGDVLVVRTGKAGAAVIVPSELAGANCIDLLIIRRSVVTDSRFLYHFINSPTTLGQVEAHSVGAIQEHYNTGTLAELRVSGMPLSEQRAIAAFLDRETARIDALVAKVRDAIDRLKELRTALISAAVTGKIDVREEAAA